MMLPSLLKLLQVRQAPREGVLNQETYWVTNRNPRRSRRGGCQCCYL